MRKRLNKKGFTLAELLIVVAIIGVLVAVSIPIFTAQLEKAREKPRILLISVLHTCRERSTHQSCMIHKPKLRARMQYAEYLIACEFRQPSRELRIFHRINLARSLQSF